MNTLNKIELFKNINYNRLKFIKEIGEEKYNLNEKVCLFDLKSLIEKYINKNSEISTKVNYFKNAYVDFSISEDINTINRGDGYYDSETKNVLTLTFFKEYLESDLDYKSRIETLENQAIYQARNDIKKQNSREDSDYKLYLSLKRKFESKNLVKE